MSIFVTLPLIFVALVCIVFEPHRTISNLASIAVFTIALPLAAISMVASAFGITKRLNEPVKQLFSRVGAGLRDTPATVKAAFATFASTARTAIQKLKAHRTRSRPLRSRSSSN